MKIAAIILAVIVVLFGVSMFIGGDEPKTDGSAALMDEAKSDDTQPPATETPARRDNQANNNQTKPAGKYVSYSPEALSANSQSDIVLFFHAPWCPTCRQLDANLNESSLPRGLTILKTDYDSETELKKKYGVTYQHTLVQVDSNGNQIGKWSNSYTVDQIVEQLK